MVDLCVLPSLSSRVAVLITYKTRDRHAAAALGRPLRIRDEDCDVEMLDENDFLVDLDFDDLFCEQHDFHIMYSIEMSKLAIICKCYRPVDDRYASVLVC